MAQIDTPSEINTERQELSPEEKSRFDRMFEKGLEDTYVERDDVLVSKLREYRAEIMAAAQIARAQFEQPFGGVDPTEGQFVASRIFSGYFGWDSWENLPDLSQGMNDWLDGDTPDNLNSGTGGFASPLKVGENAVHCIIGFGTYHDSPKVSAIKPEINESPRTVKRTKYEWTRTDLQAKWLDTPLVLPENALFAARLYADNAGKDMPRPVGVSFIKSRAAQVADPAEMTDGTSSTSDNIVAIK